VSGEPSSVNTEPEGRSPIRQVCYESSLRIGCTDAFGGPQCWSSHFMLNSSCLRSPPPQMGAHNATVLPGGRASADRYRASIAGIRPSRSHLLPSMSCIFRFVIRNINRDESMRAPR